MVKRYVRGLSRKTEPVTPASKTFDCTKWRALNTAELHAYLSSFGFLFARDRDFVMRAVGFELTALKEFLDAHRVPEQLRNNLYICWRYTKEGGRELDYIRANSNLHTLCVRVMIDIEEGTYDPNTPALPVPARFVNLPPVLP